ncbi:MAG: glycosyltransferase family 4 protein [Candidatus Dojkabacteria bacterium]|nr:glycosyltransferase family 4 protein [Candidatus Dojkabacteria bacterium]
MKKIIYISTFLYPEIGGVEKQCIQIANKIKMLGYNVEIFTTDASHIVRRLSKKQIQLRETKFEYTKTFRYILKLEKYFYFAPGLVLKLLNSKFDILHIHNVHDSHLIFALIIAKLKKKKVIVTGHNPFSVKNKISYAIFHFILRKFARFIDKYICIVDIEEKLVKKILNLKDHQIIYIPNGVDDEFFLQNNNIKGQNNQNINSNNIEKIRYFKKYSIDIQKYNKIVGWYGRISESKGLIKLKTAIANNTDTLFFFHGPNNDNYIYKLLSEFKNFHNVFFSQRVISVSEIKKFLQLIDYFIMPSEYEAFGLTLIEAISQGTEVLFSDQISIANLLNKNNIGIMIFNNDSNEWSSIIKSLKTNPTKNKQYIEFAKQYTWGNIIKQLNSIYLT